MIALFENNDSIRILTARDCLRIRFHFRLKGTCTCSCHVDDLSLFLCPCAADDRQHKLLNSLCLSRIPIDDDSIRNVTLTFPNLKILDISWCDKLSENSMVLIASRLPLLFSLNVWGIPAVRLWRLLRWR
jgi:hypothetical protein